MAIYNKATLLQYSPYFYTFRVSIHSVFLYIHFSIHCQLLYIAHFYTLLTSIHCLLLYLPCFHTFPTSIHSLLLSILQSLLLYTLSTSIHCLLLYLPCFYTFPTSIHSLLLYILQFLLLYTLCNSIHSPLLYTPYFSIHSLHLYIHSSIHCSLLYIPYFYTFPTFIHKELFLLKYEKSNLDAITHRFLNCHISVNLGSLPVTYFKLHLFVQTEDDHSQLEILRKKVLKLSHTHIMFLCVFCFKVINLILLQN